MLLLPAAIVAGQELHRDAGARASLPEHADVRQENSELIAAPLGELLRFDEHVERTASGRPISVELRQNAQAVYLLFLNRIEGRYPVYGEGAYIIKRSREDGSFLQLKIFLRTDPDFFVRVFPPGKARNGDAAGAGRASMDIYLAGRRVYERVRLPVGFERVLTMPFADIVHMTGPLVRWDLVLGSPPARHYQPLTQMQAHIHSVLAEGDPPAAAAATLGSTVGAGMHSFLASWQRTSIEAADTIPKMMERHFQEAPLFTQRPTEVRDVPFSRYIAGRGYRVAELPQLLYVLALTEPGTGYVLLLEEAGRAATKDAQGNSARTMPSHVPRDEGATPERRRSLIALPRIAHSGSFELTLFAPAGEVSPDSIFSAYAKWTARLVRLPAIE